ncbi:MAG TPA: EAL domain-containing protein [Steroidobacteraceae bacterium]|nr:EAL domain-containing protein [Steroidobacteraceae bacterium]
MQALDRSNDLERACAELAAHQAAIDHHAAVAIVDPAGNILRVNDLFCQILGFSRAELVGQNHRLLSSGRHPRTFWVDLWRTISHGQVWHGEVCNRAKDGRLVWLDTTVVPVRDADDHIVQYIDIRTDATERKRVEAGLVAARQTAEATSRARSGVIAQAGEALRVPLDAMLEHVDRLRAASGRLPATAAHDVEALYRQAPALRAIVEDVLDLARIDAGMLVPEPAEIDTAMVVAEVLAQAGPRARAKRVELRMDVTSTPWLFTTDREQLRRTLACLVRSAVHRCVPGGEVTVQLRRPGEGRAEECLSFEVHDTGPPLDSDQLAALFDVPVSGDAGSDAGEQQPLGLCIARRLAGLLNGDLAARSERGAGTVLTLALRTLRHEATRRDRVTGSSDYGRPSGEDGPATSVDSLRTRQGRYTEPGETDRVRQRLLVVDDAPIVHELVARHLRDFGLVIEHADSGFEALRLALQHPPDLILLDYDLTDMDGLETIRRLRCSEKLESVPVIFVTGSTDSAVEVQAFRNGAVDFLRKPFQPAVLRARVRAALQTRALRDLLEREALHDRLTGLPNRTLIQGRIGDAVAMKRADPTRNYALLFLDFDRFKLLNDTLGHEAGDELLRQIAQRMRSVTRATDMIVPGAAQALTARLGGDEFVMLLEGLGEPQDAVVVAERLLETLAAEFAIRGTHVVSTASIGIVLGDESYGSAIEVLRDADAAMYEAKAAGRGRCVVFDKAMRARVEDRVQLERDLRIALEQRELFLEYQPIVSLKSGQIEGIEALIRWTHPSRGRVPPHDFVQIAEETGLIGPIGEWALAQACHDFRLLRDAMAMSAPRSVSVNVSRQQLGSRDFPGRVHEILARAGVEPGALKIEVTENGIMRDPDQAVRALRALKSLGVGVHVDDFGTGSSSLACLHQFPVDTLKIDRSFVANSGETPGLAALLLAIVQMARTLGIGVVAEGIETPDQLLLLQSIDCQYGQGYLLGRPMPVESIVAYRRETPPALVVPADDRRGCAA